MTPPIRLHAVYLCLGDAEFLEPSIRSIYDDVDAITVITTLDRDWQGHPRRPDNLIEEVLGRTFDPDRKIELIVSNETSEARSRNRVMDWAAPRRRSLRVRRQHDGDAGPPPVDYFLIVDPDEIYDAGGVRRLAEFAGRSRLPVYRAAGVRYFKRWTYRVDGLEWSTVLVRADWRLTYLRNWIPARWRRAVAKLPVLPRRVRDRVRQVGDVPADVAVFHHGSYVGPRQRIADKLASFGHAHEVAPAWLTDVYDPWTPASRNFNPAYPHLYPSARRIAISELPAAVREHAWPAEYLA
jgi:hypothetical protein